MRNAPRTRRFGTGIRGRRRLPNLALGPAFLVAVIGMFIVRGFAIWDLEAFRSRQTARGVFLIINAAIFAAAFPTGMFLNELNGDSGMAVLAMALFTTGGCSPGWVCRRSSSPGCSAARGASP